MYPTDKEKDWGAWALHADLPLNQTSENGEVLIACEWLLSSVSQTIRTAAGHDAYRSILRLALGEKNTQSRHRATMY